MRTWILQDAKARFSELVSMCLRDGPQLVTRHGRDAVVILPAEEYRTITAPRQNLKVFLLSAPRVDLDIRRSGEEGRKVVL